MRRTWWTLVFSGLVAASAALAGCGDDDTNGTTDAAVDSSRADSSTGDGGDASTAPMCSAAQKNYLTDSAAAVSTASSKCGTDCIGAPTAMQATCFLECFNIETMNMLAAGNCSACVAGRVLCVQAKNCTGACVNMPTSPGCVSCLCTGGCQAAFDTCVGGVNTAAVCEGMN